MAEGKQVEVSDAEESEWNTQTMNPYLSVITDLLQITMVKIQFK